MFARRHYSEKNALQSSRSAFEGLESRVLMSGTVTQPNFANFANTSGLRFNGYGQAVTTVKNEIQLTDGGNYESRSAIWAQKVPIDTFSTTFSFHTSKAKISADGLTFVIENYGTNIRGHSGANLGYSGPQAKKSVAVAFNFYNNGGYGSNFGFAQSGILPVTETSMDPINLHNGDVFTATVTYDGTTLKARVVDTGNPSDVFTSSEDVNIPSLVGGTTAFVGFTGATGVQFSTQDVTSWNYSGNDTPSIRKHATAKPTSATLKAGTTLSVTGNGAGGAAGLTYTWAATTVPSSKAKITYSANGNNAASTTKVGFKTRGRYVFVCTVKDKYGFTVSSNSVVVKVA